MFEDPKVKWYACYWIQLADEIHHSSCSCRTRRTTLATGGGDFNGRLFSYYDCRKQDLRQVTKTSLKKQAYTKRHGTKLNIVAEVARKRKGT